MLLPGLTHFQRGVSSRDPPQTRSLGWGWVRDSAGWEAQSVAEVEGAKPALDRELGVPTETTPLPLPPQSLASKGTAGSGGELL